MGMYGILLVCMECYGYVLNIMGMYWIIWICLGYYGYVWNIMGMYMQPKTIWHNIDHYTQYGALYTPHNILHKEHKHNMNIMTQQGTLWHTKYYSQQRT